MFIERGVDFHNNESTFVSIYKQIIMYKYKCYQIEPQTRLKVIRIHIHLSTHIPDKKTSMWECVVGYLIKSANIHTVG